MTGNLVFQRIEYLSVIGGFLDGLRVNFGDGLNTIIGARGTGKTTVIECIAYALDTLPNSDHAPQERKRVETLMKRNLNGGRIEVGIRAKDGTAYKVTRSFGEEPIVVDVPAARRDVLRARDERELGVPMVEAGAPRGVVGARHLAGERETGAPHLEPSEALQLFGPRLAHDEHAVRLLQVGRVAVRELEAGLGQVLQGPPWSHRRGDEGRGGPRNGRRGRLGGAKVQQQDPSARRLAVAIRAHSVRPADAACRCRAAMTSGTSSGLLQQASKPAARA